MAEIRHRGTQGHLNGEICRFHLQTLVSHRDVTIFVSTAGMRMDLSRQVLPLYQDTGIYFETRVFHGDGQTYPMPCLARPIDLRMLLQIDATLPATYGTGYDPAHQLIVERGHEDFVQLIFDQLEAGERFGKIDTCTTSGYAW